MTRHAIRGAIVVLVAVSAVAATTSALATTDAAPTTMQVMTLAEPLLPTLRSSKVPVLLPTTVTLDAHHGKLYARGTGKKGTWSLTIETSPHCGGKLSCFIATFVGTKPGALPKAANATLADGSPAVFTGRACGASCAPETLDYTKAGTILYRWAIKRPLGGTQADMVKLADEANAAGAR